jgi:subtilisin family serine protease
VHPRRHSRPRLNFDILRTILRCELLEDRLAPAADATFSVNSQLFAVDPSQYRPDDILVRFRDGVTAAQLIGSQFDPGTVIGDATGLIPGMRVVQLGTGVSVAAAVAAYSSSSLVDYAQPDFRIHLESIPNDPLFNQQWDMHNTGQDGGTPGDDINAPAAWNLTTGTGNTVVAVIDTGVDYNHQDLYDNIWINQAEIPASRKANLIDVDGDGRITFYDLNDPRNQGTGKITDINHDGRIDAADILAPMQKTGGVDNGLGGWADGISEHGDTAHIDDLVGWNFVGNNNNPMDDNEHGTHVSGTIAGMGNNGVGIAGIDWNARIMPVKILDASGSGAASDVIRGLNYAVANGATISNNSYGGDPFSQALQDALSSARAAGHIFVAAAGNGNFLGIGQNNDTTPFYPASYNLDNVVAVAATDSNDQLASFSNYGSKSVDLAAPGVNILSTLPNNSYGFLDGTSMATPHVTGTLALVRDLHPTWTYLQVINQVLNSVDPLPSLTGKVVTGGRLDLAKAILPPPVIDLNWTGGSLSGPTTDDWFTPFTVNRTYNITGEAAKNDFNISYYASSDTIFGNADDVLIGTETISSAADKSLGTHTGTSSPLQVPIGGTFHLFALLDSGLSINETNESNNVLMSGQTIVVNGPTVVDNATPAYSETGSGWQSSAQGYAGALRYHASGTGANTANWQVSGLLSGNYEIQATWNPDANHATNATFSVYDGSTLVQTVQVSQVPTPSGPTVGGVPFQSLGTFAIYSGTLKVVLSDAANGFVVADAIRYIPLAPPTTDLNWSAGGITGPTATDFQSKFTVNRAYTISGTPVTSDFAISYYASSDSVFGNADDILLGSETITAAADKSAGSHSGTSPNLQITTGGVYYLFAKLDTGNAIIETDKSNNVAQAPQTITVAGPVIVDNSQPGYTETGSGWLSWGLGYNGNLRYKAAGNGSNTANWQATGLGAGSFEVDATWNGDANHATNAQYSIYNGNTFLQTVTVNQQASPSGTIIGGVAFQPIATVTIASGTLSVVLSDAANGYVVADAVRLVPLPPPTVDLNWNSGGISAPTSTDFQSTFTINRTYSVAGSVPSANFNIAYYASPDATFGNADDVLLGTETISAAADKSIGTHSGASPALQIGLGGVYYLFAKIDSGSAILETNENNNVAQAPQTISVVGPVIVDNSQAGYSETGSGWLNWGLGYGGSLHYHAAGSGANTATWQATGLSPGLYQIQATWNGDGNHASNAPFSIYDGTTLRQTVLVNQTVTPSGPSFGGVNFQNLATVTINSGTAQITLSDAGNGYVVADAVRLVPLPPPAIDLNWTGGGITGPTTTDFLSKFTINRTYNISTSAATSDFTIGYYASPDATFGNSDDILIGTETISAAADKTVGSHSGTSPSLQITMGGTFYLFARLDNGAAIPESNEDNNVAQAPQTISVTGTVIVDNVDAGYSETGSGWLSWGLGYGGNLRYKSAGTGSNTANWQVNGLNPGNYQIQGTWNADGNHATNASFSFYDGSTLVQTVQVDERPTPSGPLVGGVTFQTLATVPTTTGTIRVVLTDAANGYVVADAVRLVPVVGPAEFGPARVISSPTTPVAQPTPFTFGGALDMPAVRPFEFAPRDSATPPVTKSAFSRADLSLPSFLLGPSRPSWTPFAVESPAQTPSPDDQSESPLFVFASSAMERSLVSLRRLGQ